MPFKTPSLQELRARDQADMRNQLSAAPLSFRGTLLDILAAVHAGSAHGLYGALAFYAPQLFPHSATDDYLDQALQWRGVTRLPAQYATGAVIFKGSDGATIPINTPLQSAAGLSYHTTSEGVITHGQAIVAVMAEHPGSAYNLPATAPLSLSLVLIGIDNSALSDKDGISGGSDVETDTAYRARALDQITEPNIYGKKGDWSLWAKQATGEVTQAWEVANYDNRGVLLIQVMNGALPVSAGGIILVKEYLKQVAPVGVFWDVITTEPKADDYVIHISPDSTTNRDLVISTIDNWYQARSAPGITINPHTIGNLLISLPNIDDAIIKSPNAPITHGLHEYPVLGNITWSAS